MWVYTNRGIGMTVPAVRLNCRPEITVITLRRA
jgi:predicted MPP superfamily phosphohydrolase